MTKVLTCVVSGPMGSYPPLQLTYDMRMCDGDGGQLAPLTPAAESESYNCSCYGHRNGKTRTRASDNCLFQKQPKAGHKQDGFRTALIFQEPYLPACWELAGIGRTRETIYSYTFNKFARIGFLAITI